MKHHTLVLALSIAACSHIVIYSLLQLWPAPNKLIESKSIPVTLIVSAESPASVASKAASHASQNKDFLITKATSTFSRSTSSDSPGSSPSKQEQSKANATATAHQNTVNKASSKRQLFTQKSKTERSISAKTNDAKHEMNEYEVTLLEHLLKSNLYNQFHIFMAREKTKEISFTLEISLFDNGAIKSASLTEKDKNLPIDKLAVTAAYNASPYPQPPEDDYKKHYTYQVMMTYDNKALH